MSQGDLTVPDGDGASVLADMNAAHARLASKASGTATPGDLADYEEFVDTDTPGGGIVSHHIKDGAGTLIKLGQADNTNHTYKHDDSTLYLPSGFIDGYTYANNGTDAANDIDFASGYAVDDTGAKLIRGGALTKRLDVAWAVGTNEGMLDTGSVGNNQYYLYAILRSDTGVVDYLASLSATSPTMPANYDYKRLIGWLLRESGAIRAFKIYELPGGGIELLWNSKSTDISLAGQTFTTRRTDSIRAPTAFSTLAHLTVSMVHSAGAGTVTCTVSNPELAAADDITLTLQVVNIAIVSEIETRLSAAGLLGSKSNTATLGGYVVKTHGFKWSRR